MNPTSSELNPAAFLNDSSMNLGDLMVKLALPNGTINHLGERIKTSQRSWEGRIPGRYYEIRNSFDAGRTDCN